jgi:multidrug transporter EmrE-like cation transporter
LFWSHGAETSDRAQDRHIPMWFLMMLVILLTNGMSAFGLKVIAGWGLPESAKFPYLTLFYAGGLASIALPLLSRGLWPKSKELGWGVAMAALSIGGQVSMAKALNHGVPGHVVFPVAVGGSVLIVAVAGRLLFRERMNPMSVAGLITGLIAVVVLSMG